MMKHDKQERYYAYILRRSREENQKEEEFKEACRLFWMVKGHLHTSESTILSSAESYFKRLWRMGCDGAPIADYEEGFEEAYEERIKNGYK